MQQNNIVKLSDREHVLKRQSMYLGSIKPIAHEDIFLEDDKFVYREYVSVDGLLKIINEIIDNSIDEAIRTKFQFANKIKISINDSQICVEDNGRGVPVIKESTTGEYMPVLAFTHAKAGSNFSDEGRTTAGMNGIGSFVCNCFSKKFTVLTADGQNQLTLKCTDNMAKISHSVSASDKMFTRVTFEPDFEKFGMTSMDDIHLSLIKQRLIHLAICFPQIQFKFNNEAIKLKNTKSYLSSYSDAYLFLESEKYIIAVMPNEFDDFRQTSFVNGLDIKNGGNHIDFVAYEIISRLRARIAKKYKTVKPGDIKNRLRFVIIFRDFNNVQFDSQTKERLTNSGGEIKDFLNIDPQVWEKFAWQISKCDAIIEPIIESFKMKEELKNRLALNDINKGANKKKIRNEKYFPAIKDNKYLVLAEGDSAAGGLMGVLGRDEIGYFAMRGVPLNSYEVTAARLQTNEEFKTIIQIMGITLGKKTQDAETSDTWFTYNDGETTWSLNANDEYLNNKTWQAVTSLTGIQPLKKVPNAAAYDSQVRVRRRTEMNIENVLLAQDADCIESHCEVRMADGSYKKISDIIPGDEVKTHNSSSKTVLNVVETEKFKTVNVVIQGKTYKFSENHKLIVLRDGEVQTIFAKDVRPTDMFAIK